MTPGRWMLGLALLGLLLAGCAGEASPPPTPGAAPPTPGAEAAPAVDRPTLVPTTAPTPLPLPSGTAPLTPTRLPEPSATPANAHTLPPERWQEWPVIPEVGESARALYQRGLAAGTNPQAFSKVGDCQNVDTYFLGVFDDPQKYRLGEHTDLEGAIAQFQGSYSRRSAAVRGGFNVASVLSPLKSDPAVCAKGETPLECETRLHNPSIVFISMEQWWSNRPVSLYEDYLRQVVTFFVERGIVPILATKADNLEGEHRINAAVARVAYDFDLPLWNFWAAVQPLPSHGLWGDGFHLTYAQSFFDDPQMMKQAWPVRNLTALQSLDTVWRFISQP